MTSNNSYQQQEIKLDTDGKSSPSASAPPTTIKLFGYQFERNLLISKAFYFCFFSAFGSLFPLIAVYFKQLGMTAAQAGMLVGIRPLIEFASAPFWGSFADRFRKGRLLLMFSLACWILFTLGIGFVEPGTPFCIREYRNASGSYRQLTKAGPIVKGGALGYLKQATGLRRRRKAATGNIDDEESIDLWSNTEFLPGISPDLVTADKVPNYNEAEYGRLVSPPHSTRVYREPAVEQVFMLLLLLVCLGEFFSAPAVALVDCCTLAMLRDEPQRFGQQRLFGSVGWGAAMFIMGIGLDYFTFSNHPCPTKNTTEKNYTLCFVVFSIWMGAAMVVATQLQFASGNDQQRPDQVSTLVMDARIGEVDPVVAENARARAPAVTVNDAGGNELLSTFRSLASAHLIAFLFTTCWMGFGAGLIFAFLFWHLQDIGGSPVLFGIMSITNHVSEVIAYFYAFRLINQFGHIKVLYMCLAANVVRFLAISVLGNPWLVLPFQCVQGVTHAIVWASATSYISLAAPANQKSSAQTILLVLYHGIGKGAGSLIGGAIIASIGTVLMFQIYALICLLVLGGYFGINRLFKADGIKYRQGAFEDEDGSAAPAPQGIPMHISDANFTDKFNTNSQMGANYGSVLAADPAQDAYDRYVHQPYEKQSVRFDAIPTSFGGAR